MGYALQIRDETPNGEILSASVVQFPAERTTVQELIEARVSQEVERYNARAGGKFAGFVQPTEAEIILNGFRVAGGKSINAEKQKTAALRAFQSNGFFLLVNDRQVTELDDVILITPNTLVSFLKLVPLVGG